MADLEILIAQFGDLLLDGSDITMTDIASTQSNKLPLERNDADMTDVEPVTAQTCNMDIDAPVQSKPPKRLHFIHKTYCDAAASDSTKWIPVASHPPPFSQVPDFTSGMERSPYQAVYQAQESHRKPQQFEPEDEMDIDASEKTQIITWNTHKACHGEQDYLLED